ncbi:hypothetical protein ABH908_003939 [Pseudomonas frederiksbergensis]|nr:hypothetical protein SRABI130_05367 [Pseudomonas sp. Bi130]
MGVPFFNLIPIAGCDFRSGSRRNGHWEIAETDRLKIPKQRRRQPDQRNESGDRPHLSRGWIMLLQFNRGLSPFSQSSKFLKLSLSG